MGRPSTKQKSLKDGFYLELRNKGAKTGIRIRRDTEQQMMDAATEYKRTKQVIILGETKNGDFLSSPKEF